MIDELHALMAETALNFFSRSWNLNTRTNIETIYNHVDYVESLGLLPERYCRTSILKRKDYQLNLIDILLRWCASGGRGDKSIFLYETDSAGKLWRRAQFEGHEGWVTHLLFLDENLLISGSEDATVRFWDLRRMALMRVIPQVRD